VTAIKSPALQDARSLIHSAGFVNNKLAQRIYERPFSVRCSSI
jgi:hypothetical protein